MEKEFIIANELGLHARPASELVKLANKFSCDLHITYNGSTVDLKSIMGVLSLGVKQGSSILVMANGDDEVEALRSIGKQIEAYNLR